MDEQRKVLDCRKYPSDKKCSLAISGTEGDIMDVAVQHAVAKHGHKDTPEFRSQLRTMMQDER